MAAKEKLGRLLNTRKKRIAAAAVLVFVLCLAVILLLLLYLILQTQRKTNSRKKDVTGEQEPKRVTTFNSYNGESGIRSDQANIPRPLRSKLDKQMTCEEALATLDSSVKANADQAISADSLERVEELCPEDIYHTARVSIRKIDASTQDGLIANLNDALERPTLNIAELDSRFQKLKELSPTKILKAKKPSLL